MGTGNWSSQLEPRSFSFKFEISSNVSAAKKPEISKESFQNPPKSSLGVSKIESGASKIEPGALQNWMELILNFYIDLGGGSPLRNHHFRAQLGSNLEFQKAPKSRPKPK